MEQTQQQYNQVAFQKQQIDVLEKWVNQFVETTNKRLEENNQKLDLLMELTKHLAILQEKQTQNTESIKKVEHGIEVQELELEKQFHALEDRFIKLDVERAKSNERLHKRIDDLSEVMEKYQTKHFEASEQTVKRIDTDIDNTEKELKDLKDDYKSRVSFFRGLFFAFALFSGIGQAMIYKYFSDIEKNIAEIRIAEQKMENRTNEMERQLDMIQHGLKQIKGM